MAFDWPAILLLADDMPQRIVNLSPMSKVLADGAYSFYYEMRNWKGASYELTDDEIDEIKAAVDKLMAELERPALIGLIMPYAGNLPPSGTLNCDGDTYLRTDYPYLYEYLSGTDYIIDADTFNTPVFDGRTIIQAGTIPQGTLLGEETHTLIEAELAPHDHLYTPPVANVDLESPGAPDIFAAGVGLIQAHTSVSGGGDPHNNMQPSIAMNFCIVSGG